MGRDTALVYPDGSEARNIYEGSFLKSVTDAGGALYASLTYDLAAAGQPATLTYGNGTVTTYAYRADNRLMENITTQKGSQTLLNLSYTFDKSANVIAAVDGVRGGGGGRVRLTVCGCCGKRRTRRITWCRCRRTR